MANSIEEIQKSKKTYLAVFGALLLCTVVTVAVATQEWLDFGRHGFDHVDAIVGLAIASLKAGLVAAIFMHLNHEKKAIYWLFGAGIVFVICLFALTGFADFDPIHDPFFYKN
ncbi:MAG TPA: cytochrome C oxidase subunit IV family protein [Luteolibacter sp.]|nr:cytochrome C oxidase subunit IV family protein [Luteolibacter sp.]